MAAVGLALCVPIGAAGASKRENNSRQLQYIEIVCACEG
jgi:hypothetical protein